MQLFQNRSEQTPFKTEHPRTFSEALLDVDDDGDNPQRLVPEGEESVSEPESVILGLST